MDFEKLTLEKINKGVAGELFETELEKVVKNIDDPNVTSGKRSITLQFEFNPEKDSDSVRINVSSKCSLQNNKSNNAFGYFVLNHGKPVIVQDKFKQETLFKDQTNVTPIEQKEAVNND